MLLRFIFGFITGYFAFGWPHPRHLVLSAAVPFVWCVSDKRKHAASYIFGYYLAAARGIPAGSTVFFSYPNMLYGFLMLLTSSTILTLVWYLFFLPQNNRAFIPLFTRLLLVFIFITIPPVGIIGWASPLLSVGFLLPGTGFYGIFLFLAAVAVISIEHIRAENKRTSASILTAYILFAFFFAPDTRMKPADWQAIDTHFGRSASGSAVSRSLKPFYIILPEIEKSSAQYILLPETFFFFWSPEVKGEIQPILDRLHKRAQTIVVGAAIYDERREKYDNCLIFLSGKDEKIYRQRIPVPLSMWRPFAVDGANAYPWGKGTLRIESTESVCLLCYEQFLAWPMLRSMSGYPRPEVLIAAANQWWCGNTCIPNIQRGSAASWAMLFNIPIITATNK